VIFRGALENVVVEICGEQGRGGGEQEQPHPHRQELRRLGRPPSLKAPNSFKIALYGSLPFLYCFCLSCMFFFAIACILIFEDVSLDSRLYVSLLLSEIVQ
jgi:hypothetical protein